MLSLLALFAVLSKLATAAPCDIYAQGGTPCVAAHSTVRSLYDNFDGALYQVFRNSDNTTTDIYPLSTGGVANAGAQDYFCNSGTCLITTIYDQSGNGNHLTAAPPGGASAGAGPNGYDFTAGATGAAVTVGGQRAYGVFSSPGTGYRNDNTNGIATGNEPEGLYAIFDGTHYNGVCCYDYGNAETNNHDDGSGTMEAVYFGNNGCCGGNTLGEGDGPWVMGDLENGLWAGGSTSNNVNPSNPPIDYRFVTAVVKGNVTNQWAIRGGNSQSGALSTFWSGPRPDGYYPMNKQGAIILGIGGDNSNGAQGTFYEGAMTAGYPSDITENAVQANIVAAGYATTSQVTSDPSVDQGSTITVKNVASGQYLSVSGSTVGVSNTPSSFKVVAPLAADSGCYSFESTTQPGSYLRHYAFQLYLDNPSTTTRNPPTFNDDATFCPEAGFQGSNSNAFRSWSYPTRDWRQADDNVYIGAQGGPYAGDEWVGFPGQASWYVQTV